MDVVSALVMWGRNVAIVLDDVVLFAKPQLTRMEHTLAVATPAVKGASGVILDDTAVGGAAVSDAGVKQHREYAVLGKLFIGDLTIKLILSCLFTALQAILPLVPKIMLLLGGGYLAYEGAHKTLAMLTRTRMGRALHLPVDEEEPTSTQTSGLEAHATRNSFLGSIARSLGIDPNERRVLSDLLLLSIILSTEIILVAIGLLPPASTLSTLGSLGVVSVCTALLVIVPMLCIVRADNIANALEKSPRALMRHLGERLMRGLGPALRFINLIGTLAMLNVGGEILEKKLPYFIGLLSPSFGEAFQHIFEIVHHACVDVPLVGGLLAPLSLGFVAGTLLVGIISLFGRIRHP